MNLLLSAFLLGSSTNAKSETLESPIQTHSISHEDCVEWNAENDLADYNPQKKDTVPDELVVFGDIHGDHDLFRFLLERTSLINRNADWVHPDKLTRYVVQLGDVVDRGPKSIKAYDLIAKLRPEARSAGDDFFSLIGNHELFVLCNQFHYMSRDEIQYYFDNKPELMRAEFSKDGETGKEIRKNYMSGVRLNDVIFVHGGFGDKFRDMSFGEIKRLTFEFIDEQKCDTRRDEHDISGTDGVYWTRKISGSLNSRVDDDTITATCAYVDDLVKELGVKKIIVGHTVTSYAEVESYCDGKWIMHDNGMSRWMMASPRFSIFYKTFTKDGKLKNLSDWIHVQWQALKVAGENMDSDHSEYTVEMVLKFINPGELSVDEQEQFKDYYVSFYDRLREEYYQKVPDSVTMINK